MKIKKLAVAPTAFLHLKGPDGNFLYEGEGEQKEKVGIELFGPGSPQFAQIEERQTARAVERYKDNDGQITHVPIDQRRAETAEDLADLTSGFHHIEHDDANGQPLTGRALVVAVYSEPDLGWIKDQVAKWLGDWGKFTTGSAAS